LILFRISGFFVLVRPYDPPQAFPFFTQRLPSGPVEVSVCVLNGATRMITVEDINEAWGWTGLHAVEVLGENAFGNLIVRAEDGMYWRLSPPDLRCEPVAEDRAALDALSYNQEFLDGWYMPDQVRLAETTLGPLTAGRKYCLKIPSALGGHYGRDNLAIVPLHALIRFAGEGAQQFDGLPRWHGHD
jgi:hypothetical protein